MLLVLCDSYDGDEDDDNAGNDGGTAASYVDSDANGSGVGLATTGIVHGVVGRSDTLPQGFLPFFTFQPCPPSLLC